MMYKNISDIAIITVKGVDYHCIIFDISKSDATNLLENSVLDDIGYIKCNIKIESTTIILTTESKQKI